MKYFATILLVAAAASGCSDLTSNVNGTVTLDGKPLTVTGEQRGTIVFRPVAGGPTATAMIDADGRFSLKTGATSGVVPGDYMVSVSVVDVIPAEDESTAPSGRPTTPAVYADPLTSGLQYSVSRGRNDLKIDLKSDAGPVGVIPVVEAPTTPEASSDVPNEAVDASPAPSPDDDNSSSDEEPASDGAELSTENVAEPQS